MSATGRILVVDDEPNVRLVFRTALEAVGHEVTEAVDGEDALRKLRGGRFDLALLDLRMPVMDGMETLQRIRDENLNVPVIMITAHGSIPDAVEAMRLGAIDFVSKPVTPEPLRRAVADLLERHAAPQSASGGVQSVLTRAKREINNRNFELASELIANLREFDEMSLAEAHYLRGLMLEMRGKEAEAEAVYQLAAAADPSYEAVHLRLKMREDGRSG